MSDEVGADGAAEAEAPADGVAGASWVTTARRALDGAVEHSVEVIPRRRPVLVDRAVAVALATLAVGSALLAAAIWRELQSGNPFDRLAMPLRFVAVVGILRGLVASWPLVPRLRLAARTRRHGLALTEEGLLVRSPDGERAIPRAHVAAAIEPGDWGTRTSTRRSSPVFLLVEPGAHGDAVVSLPPIFEDNPGILAERLMRWRGLAGARPALASSTERLASKTYDDAARGAPARGVAVVRHGAGWLRRGPYAAFVFALIFADATLRLPAGISLGAVPALALVVCLAIPVTWIASTWRHVGPRRGVAFVLTSREMLLRTRAGVLRTRYEDITSVGVEGFAGSFAGWSLLEGRRPTRKLRIDRVDDAPIRYDEAFLGVPAEVAQALVELYGKGALGRASDTRS